MHDDGDVSDRAAAWISCVFAVLLVKYNVRNFGWGLTMSYCCQINYQGRSILFAFLLSLVGRGAGGGGWRAGGGLGMGSDFVVVILISKGLPTSAPRKAKQPAKRNATPWPNGTDSHVHADSAVHNTGMANTASGSRRPPKSHRRTRSGANANSGTPPATDLPPTAPTPSSSASTRQSFVSPIVGRTGAARRHHFRQNSAGSAYSSGGSVVSWGESSRRRRHRSRSRSSSVASNDQNAYSPLHTLIPSLHQPPTPMTPASFIIAPEDSETETPLDSDVEEQLDGLGLVESLMSLAPAPAENNAQDNLDDIGDNRAESNHNSRALPFQESISSQWCEFTQRYRYFIIGLSLVVGLIGCLKSLPTFIESADSTFEPPHASDSYRALQLFRRAYNQIEKCAPTDGNNETFVGGHIHRNLQVSRNNDRGQSPLDPLNPPLIVVLDALPAAENETDFHGQKTLVDGWSDLFGRARNYVMGIEAYLQQHSELGNTFLVPCVNETSSADNATIQWEQKRPLLNITSFYSLSSEGLPTTLAPATASSDGDTTVIEISYSIPPVVADSGHLKRKYVSSVMDALQQYGTSVAANGTDALGFKFSYTGLRYLGADLTESVRQSFHTIDSLALPLALTVLVIFLQSLQGTTNYCSSNGLTCSHIPTLVVLVGIPVFSIATSVAVWASVMALLTQRNVLQVSHFTPTIMMAMTIAMGLDYSLFMMSRVLSEHKLVLAKGISNAEQGEQAGPSSIIQDMTRSRIIENTIRSVGHTVLASGTTLAIAFGGLVLLPFPLLRSAGLGASVAIFSCMFVNLTLIPALLHSAWVSRKLFLTQGYHTRSLHRRRHRRGWWKRGNGSDGGGGLKLFGPGGVFEDNTCNERDRNGNGLGFVWLSGISLASEGRGRVNAANEDGDSGNDTGSSGGESHRYTSFRDLAQPLLRDQEAANATQTFDNVHDNQGSPSPWQGIALSLVNPYKSAMLLVLVVALVVPIALHSFYMKTSISFELMLPTSSPSMITSRELGSKFGKGTLSPYRLIFDGRNAQKEIDTEEGFEVMHSVIDAFIRYDLNRSDDNSGDTSAHMHFPFGPSQSPEGVNRTLYSGIAHVRGINVPHALFVSAKVCAEDLASCPVENLRALVALDKRMTSEDRFTTFLTATLSVDPFSDEGIDWLLAARGIIKMLEGEGVLKNYTVAIQGGAGIEYDVKQEVYRAAPRCIALTLVLIFVLMGFFFRSIVVPLRSIICLVLTQGFSFGLLCLTYQENLFPWIRVSNTRSMPYDTSHELSWLAPVLAFSVIIGLSTDYDIFLVDRIMENSLAGKGHVDSIVQGFCDSASTISVAGGIMAISLGGLMFGSSPALQQWSFLLTCAVLFDITLGRAVRVVLLRYTGQYSWWPRKISVDRNLLAPVDGDQAGDDDEVCVDDDEAGCGPTLSMRTD